MGPKYFTCTSSPEPVRNCTTQQLPRARRWSSVEAREPKKLDEIWNDWHDGDGHGR